MARGQKREVSPPEKGVLIRKAATCDHCKGKCTVGGRLKMIPGFYTFYDHKLCKVCATKQRLV